MATFTHLGALMGAYRIEAGWDIDKAAQAADVTVRTWQQFENTGTGVGVRRIGEMATQLGIPREALHAIADPVTVLSTVWGEDLGALIREARGDRSTTEVVAGTGVSVATLLRWESALTRPRSRDQLLELLTLLAVDPVKALGHALWPPRQQMIERPRIGQALLDQRLALGLGTRAAAAELGVSMGGYNGWERGRTRPARSYWKTIAAWLGVSEDHVATLIAPRRVDLYGRSASAKRLVTHRRAQYRSLEQVASDAGVCVSTAKSYEQGERKPMVTRVPGYASAVGIDPTELAFTVHEVDRASASFGQLILCLRTGKGDTSKVASESLGCTHTQLYHWENDRCLPKTAARRARLLTAAQSYFGVDRAELQAALDRTVEKIDPFALWLQDATTAAGLTVSQVASAMGLPRRGSAAGWFTGAHRPSVGKAAQLAKVLNVPVPVVEDQLRTQLRFAA